MFVPQKICAVLDSFFARDGVLSEKTNTRKYSNKYLRRRNTAMSSSQKPLRARKYNEHTGVRPTQSFTWITYTLLFIVTRGRISGGIIFLKTNPNGRVSSYHFNTTLKCVLELLAAVTLARTHDAPDREIRGELCSFSKRQTFKQISFFFLLQSRQQFNWTSKNSVVVFLREFFRFLNFFWKSVHQPFPQCQLTRSLSYGQRSLDKRLFAGKDNSTTIARDSTDRCLTYVPGLVTKLCGDSDSSRIQTAPSGGRTLELDAEILYTAGNGSAIHVKLCTNHNAGFGNYTPEFRNDRPILGLIFEWSSLDVRALYGPSNGIHLRAYLPENSAPCFRRRYAAKRRVWAVSCTRPSTRTRRSGRKPRCSSWPRISWNSISPPSKGKTPRDSRSGV